jgi:prepilin-type N-terminal cleavage/methylation domain-containing protein
MSTFLQHFRSSSNKGFTLIELMMVIAIMTIMTGAFLFQNRQFDSTTLLRGLVYKTALTIREAQTYGTSVRIVGTVAAPAPAYGIYISGTTNIGTYYLFGDRSRSSDGSEDIETFVLNSNYKINKFCATRSGVTSCSDAGGPTTLTILFIRPNSDACFTTNLFPSLCLASDVSVDYTQATIQIKSVASGTTRTITVTNTGQISVGAPGS